MPSAPLAVQPATPSRQAAAAPDSRGAAPPTPDHCAGHATAAFPPHRTGAAPTSGVHLRHAITSLRQVFKTSYHDPKFHRPDVIEDDYYRFRNQPSGY